MTSIHFAEVNKGGWGGGGGGWNILFPIACTAVVCFPKYIKGKKHRRKGLKMKRQKSRPVSPYMLLNEHDQNSTPIGRETLLSKLQTIAMQAIQLNSCNCLFKLPLFQSPGERFFQIQVNV